MRTEIPNHFQSDAGVGRPRSSPGHRRDLNGRFTSDTRLSIAREECCGPGRLTRSNILSGTVGPGATVALRLRPDSGAYRLFVGSTAKQPSGDEMTRLQFG